MTDQAEPGAREIPRPGMSAVEHSVDRTHALLGEFREEVGRIITRVQEDVERLFEATFGESVPRHPTDPERPFETQTERRLARIAAEQQAEMQTLALVNKVVDQRFQALLDTLQAKRILRADPSRRGF
jgi:hypothetical protein